MCVVCSVGRVWCVCKRVRGSGDQQSLFLTTHDPTGRDAKHMAANVSDAIVEILQSSSLKWRVGGDGSMESEECSAAAYVEHMKQTNRYVQDVWA